MATKSALTTAINGFITAVITQAKVRSAFLELINVLFQTTVNDELTTGSNVFWRDLNYKKHGNVTFLDGYITNKYAVPKTSLNIVAIPNSELYAKTGQDAIFFAFTDVNGTPVMLSVSAGNIYLFGTLAPNQKIRINAHYQNND